MPSQLNSKCNIITLKKTKVIHTGTRIHQPTANCYQPHNNKFAQTVILSFNRYLLGTVYQVLKGYCIPRHCSGLWEKKASLWGA